MKIKANYFEGCPLTWVVWSLLKIRLNFGFWQESARRDAEFPSLHFIMWHMIFNCPIADDRPSRCVHCYWDVIASRLLQWADLRNKNTCNTHIYIFLYVCIYQSVYQNYKFHTFPSIPIFFNHFLIFLIGWVYMWWLYQPNCILSLVWSGFWMQEKKNPQWVFVSILWEKLWLGRKSWGKM